MSGFKNRLARLYASSRWSQLAITATTILMTFIVVSALFILIGRDPLKAMYSFFQGSGLGLKPSYTKQGGILSDFFSFLGILAPMLLASLGVVIGLKGGLFNIGVSGQMLFSGFMATILVGYANFSPAVSILLILIVGLVSERAARDQQCETRRPDDRDSDRDSNRAFGRVSH